MKMLVDSCMLKWAQFQENATISFNTQRTNDLYTDVTFVADDNSMMKAHKLILTASSDYFSNLFSTMPSGYPIVCLDGVDHLELKYLVEFIYTGELQVPNEKVIRLLQLSKKYSIRGLKDLILPSDYIKDTDPNENKELISKDSPNINSTDIDKVKDINFQDISVPGKTPKVEEEDESHNEENQKQLENEIELKTYIASDHAKDSTIREKLLKDSNMLKSNEIPQYSLTNTKKENLIVHLDDKSLPYSEFEKSLGQLIRPNKHGILECSTCSKTDSLSHLKEHVEKHLVGLSFECKICSQKMRYSHQNRKNQHKISCQPKMKPINFPDIKITEICTKSINDNQIEINDKFLTLDESQLVKNEEAQQNRQKTGAEDNGPIKHWNQNLTYHLGNQSFSWEEFEEILGRIYKTNKKGYFECNVCARKTTVKSSMQSHAETHLKDMFVMCIFCGHKMTKSYKNREKQHLSTCMNNINII